MEVKLSVPFTGIQEFLDSERHQVKNLLLLLGMAPFKQGQVPGIPKLSTLDLVKLLTAHLGGLI